MARRPRNTLRQAVDGLPDDVRLTHRVATAVFALAALVLLAAAGAWAARAPMFTVRAIVLDGDLERSNLATVRANALPQLAGNFFSFDLDRGRAAFQSVPWVRQAVVRRVWPDRLAVTLEEHRAAALWQDEAGSERLVNSHGEVFEANLGDVEDENLPTLSGPAGTSAQMLAMLDQLNRQLQSIDARVDVLRLSSRGSWHAELDTNADLELGRGSDDEVVARVGRFVRTLGQVTQRLDPANGAGGLLAADLRHPDGYALRLRGVSTVAAAAASDAAQPH